MEGGRELEKHREHANMTVHATLALFVYMCISLKYTFVCDQSNVIYVHTTKKMCVHHSCRCYEPYLPYFCQVYHLYLLLSLLQLMDMNTVKLNLKLYRGPQIDLLHNNRAYRWEMYLLLRVQIVMLRMVVSARHDTHLFPVWAHWLRKSFVLSLISASSLPFSMSPTHNSDLLVASLSNGALGPSGDASPWVPPPAPTEPHHLATGLSLRHQRPLVA